MFAKRKTAVGFAHKAQMLALAGALLLGAAGPLAARAAPDSFADLAEELSPAVVNISTSQTISGGNVGVPEFNLPPGSPFEEFFREFFENELNGEGRRPRRVNSLGSGFVIDKSGLVVTNNHVIDGADEVQVNFADGTSLEARVIGHDPATDIALLKVEPSSPLPFVTFGDAEESRVGDWVLAIGNPFGLNSTVTAGIISAANREIGGRYDDFIQTDASINRGNSGGPLFNMEGEVIGINTAIFSPTGGSIGIGFAISSSVAENVIQQLQEYGETRRGWIGVRIQTVSDEIAESLGLDEPRGALVADVTAGGPAEAAGVQVGDLIVKFDGKDVENMRALPRLVADTQIGKRVRMEVLRDGRRQTLTLTVARLEEERISALERGEEPEEDSAPSTSENKVLGLAVAEATPALRRQFGIDDDVDGLVVLDVDEDSPALGSVAVGDVIVRAESHDIKTADQLSDALGEAEQADKASVLLMLNRRGTPRFEGIKIDESKND